MEIGDILDQPSGAIQDSGDGVTEQIVRQGSYDALLEWAGEPVTDGSGEPPRPRLKARAICDISMLPGKEDRRYVASWQLERLDGGYGRLAITVGDPADNRDGDEEPDNVVETRWGVKNVQMQIPLSRFYKDGTWSLGAAPDAREIAMWRQEPRKELYDAYQFLTPEGIVATLSSHSQAVAAKYRRGIESVMRFYPVVTRTVTYARGMSQNRIDALHIGARLSRIDTPDRTFGLQAGCWLCIQDDAEEDADGRLVRITGWMGCTSLDQDLYGDSNRWEPMN